MHRVTNYRQKEYKLDHEITQFPSHMIKNTCIKNLRIESLPETLPSMSKKGVQQSKKVRSEDQRPTAHVKGLGFCFVCALPSSITDHVWTWVALMDE